MTARRARAASFRMPPSASSMCRMRPLRPGAACEYSLISLKTTQAFGRPEVTIAVKPSFLELQEPSLIVVKFDELAKKLRPNVARSELCVRLTVQEFGLLADVLTCFLLQAVDGNDILRKIVQEVYAARSAEIAMRMPLVLKSALGKSARTFHCTSANIERTSRSRSPPCTCRQ